VRTINPVGGKVHGATIKGNHTMTSKKKSKSSLLRLPANLHKHFVKEITVSWQKTLESVIETGKRLIEAKGALPFVTFEQMITRELPFKRNTAERLMIIAEHPVISNPKYRSRLPAHYSTLYELTKLDESALLAKIDDLTITSQIERKEAIALRRHPADPPKVTGSKRSNARGKYLQHLMHMSQAELEDELKALSAAVKNMSKTISISVEIAEDEIVEAEITPEVETHRWGKRGGKT
jgi:hypothetical protein